MLQILLIALLAGIPADERQALIAIFETTQGASWARNGNWLGPEGSEGDWAGVVVEEGHVVELRLGGNLLEGPLPPQIGDLTHLRLLDLAAQPTFSPISGMRFNNHVQGPLPQEIGRLAALEELNLQHAVLSADDFPASFADLSSLMRLSLHGLQGEAPRLPESLWQLKALQDLDLGGLGLTEIPQQVGQLENLRTLNLEGNAQPVLNPALSDVPLEVLSIAACGYLSLPQALRAHPTLRDLDVSGNQGLEFPLWLSEDTALEVLKASSMDLRSLQPLGQLPNLKVLEANVNLDLQIDIPPASFPSLEELKLRFNSLTELPPSLVQLGTLRRLDVSDNLLTDLDPDLAALDLEELQIRGNFLTSLPLGVLEQWSGLTRLDASFNPLGEAPQDLNRLSALQSFRCQSCALLGGLPPEWGQMENLRQIEVSSNPLGGAIPQSWAGWASLQDFRARECGLTGSLEVVATWPNLHALQLANNELEGSFPPALASLENLAEIDLSRNRLSGPLPQDLGGSPSLRRVDLASNAFIGEVPSPLADVAESLNLRFNALDAPPQLAARIEALHGQAAEPESGWRDTETLAPLQLRARQTGAGSLRLSWLPARFEAFVGATIVEGAFQPEGPFEEAGRTADTLESSLELKSLPPDTPLYLRLRSLTRADFRNKQDVLSLPSPAIEVSLSQAPPPNRWAIPLFVTRPGDDTGLAFTNVGETSAQIELRLLTPEGLLAPRPLNPALLSLEPRCQIARTLSEIFGAQAAREDDPGWILAESQSGDIAGLTLLFSNQRLDGTAPRAASDRLLLFDNAFPSSGAPETALVRLINPNEAPLEALLMLCSQPPQPEPIPSVDPLALSENSFRSALDCTFRDERLLELPPLGLMQLRLEELFDSLPSFPAHLAIIASDEMAAFQAIETGQGESIAILAAQPPERRFSVDLPHYASGEGLTTTLRVVSPTLAQQVDVELRDDDGMVLDPLGGIVRVEAGQSVELPLDDFFGLDSSHLLTGSVRVQGIFDPVVGSLLIQGPQTAAALSFEQRPAKAFAFSQLASTEQFFTGIAVVNAAFEPAQVEIEAFRPDGESLGRAEFPLAPNGRRAALVHELIPAASGQLGGWVRIASNQPVVAQQIFGDFAGTFFAAVPPLAK